MSIEFSEKSYQRQVSWWDSSFQNAIVLIPETSVGSRIEPRVVSIHCEKYLVVVLMVELLKNLSNCICREHRVIYTCIDYIHDFLWIWAFISKSVSKLFVPLVKFFKLLIVEVALPVIGPTLS